LPPPVAGPEVCSAPPADMAGLNSKHSTFFYAEKENFFKKLFCQQIMWDIWNELHHCPNKIWGKNQHLANRANNTRRQKKKIQYNWKGFVKIKKATFLCDVDEEKNLLEPGHICLPARAPKVYLPPPVAGPEVCLAPPADMAGLN